MAIRNEELRDRISATKIRIARLKCQAVEAERSLEMLVQKLEKQESEPKEDDRG